MKNVTVLAAAIKIAEETKRVVSIRSVAGGIEYTTNNGTVVSVPLPLEELKARLDELGIIFSNELNQQTHAIRNEASKAIVEVYEELKQASVDSDEAYVQQIEMLRNNLLEQKETLQGLLQEELDKKSDVGHTHEQYLIEPQVTEMIEKARYDDSQLNTTLESHQDHLEGLQEGLVGVQAEVLVSSETINTVSSVVDRIPSQLDSVESILRSEIATLEGFLSDRLKSSHRGLEADLATTQSTLQQVKEDAMSEVRERLTGYQKQVDALTLKQVEGHLLPIVENVIDSRLNGIEDKYQRKGAYVTKSEVVAMIPEDEPHVVDVQIRKGYLYLIYSDESEHKGSKLPEATTNFFGGGGGSKVVSATEEVAGKIRIATQGETNLGDSDETAITPAKLKAILANIGATLGKFTTRINLASYTPYMIQHNLNLVEPDDLILQAMVDSKQVNLEVEATGVNTAIITSSVDLLNVKIVAIG